MLNSVFNPSCLGNQQMLQPREAVYPSWVTTRQVPSLDGTASLLPPSSAASQLGRRQLSTCRTELPLMNWKALSGQARSYLSNLTHHGAVLLQPQGSESAAGTLRASPHVGWGYLFEVLSSVPLLGGLPSTLISKVLLKTWLSPPASSSVSTPLLSLSLRVVSFVRSLVHVRNAFESLFNCILIAWPSFPPEPGRAGIMSVLFTVDSPGLSV